MSNILCFIQHHSGQPVKASLSALSAAKEVAKAWSKSTIVGICIGDGAKEAASNSLQYGLSKAIYCEDPKLSKYCFAYYGPCILKAVEQNSCDTIILAATSTGKDLLPSIAAKLNAGQASDVIAVNSDGSLKRPMFAGNVISDVEILSTTKCLSIRPSAFLAAQADSVTSGQLEELKLDLNLNFTSEVVSYELSASERPELTEAEVVVSGGRALQSSENFEKYIFPLADCLGAGVGASRAAVDSGYCPNDWQVGQTGKVVAPNLYIAIGISGAIQHMAGMKDSKTIVAINKDAEAPIFEIADYGLVGDLFQILPELTEKLRKVKTG